MRRTAVPESWVHTLPHGHQLGAWGDPDLFNSVFCSKLVAYWKHLLVPVTRKWAIVILEMPQTDPNGS